MNRILDHQLFLYFLDMEVKRARRYQDFFCILTLKLNRLSSANKGMAFETCYQQLSEFAKEEFRESDILGSMGENRLVAILPYGNRSAGTRAKFHFESCLKYYDFKKEGYEVQIHEICFPEDGTGISDLVKKLLGSEAR